MYTFLCVRSHAKTELMSARICASMRIHTHIYIYIYTHTRAMQEYQFVRKRYVHRCAYVHMYINKHVDE